VDMPDDDRRVNIEPIPRMGGLIIYAVVIVLTIAFYAKVFSISYFLIGSFIIFLVGFIDDIKPQKWYIKFLFQAGTAVFMIFFLHNHGYQEIQVLGIKLPFIIDKIILFFFIVGSINAFNLLDGLDGLTTGLTLIVVSLCFIVGLSGNFIFLPLLSALLIGSSLGFLKFNAYPAQIFLGDTGSLILGYFSTAALLATAGEVNKHNIDLLFPIIVLAVPLFDTIRVLTARLRRRVNPFLPDTNHIHHLILSKKIRHKTSVFIILGFVIVFALIGLYYAKDSQTIAILFFAVMLIIFMNAPVIIEFIIRKEHLLFYGRSIKKLPVIFINIYKNYLLPIVSISVIGFLILYLFSETIVSNKIYMFFIGFILLTIIYSLINLKKRHQYADIIVLLNIILFFFITGSGGSFYKLYRFPIIQAININQIFLIVLFPMIIFYTLFRDRLETVRELFFTGIDLIIALVIGFVLVSFQVIELENAYKISDILLRSFLIYLLYKIVIRCFPKLQISLYFSTFLIAIIAITKSLF